MVLAPGEMYVLRVDRDSVDHRITILELAIQLAEGRDLGRTNEGEVLRPEEDDLPLARVGRVADLLEGGLGIGAHHRLEVEGRKLVADGQHETLHEFLDWNVSNMAMVN